MKQKMENNGKIKLIKINGIKTKVVLPLKLDPNKIPNEVESEKNHPKGEFLTT